MSIPQVYVAPISHFVTSCVTSHVQISRELMTFNSGPLDNVDQPQQHVWFTDDNLWQQSVYFNQPSTGNDFITTFNASGLVVLSDLNLTVPERNEKYICAYNFCNFNCFVFILEFSLCNSTLGFGRCLNGDCFNLNDTCNGVVDCSQDGFDEMACTRVTSHTNNE